MLRFLAQRLANGFAVMFVVSMVSFAIFNFIGDPVNNLVGETATQAEKEALRVRLGLDAPLPVQYLLFLGRALQGEFGVSYRNLGPVPGVPRRPLPGPVELGLVGAFVAPGLGPPAGIFRGYPGQSLGARRLQV